MTATVVLRATSTRLPAPTVQAHAANLAVVEGRLTCVWFGGTQEGVRDVVVHVAHLSPAGDRWSEPEVLSSDPLLSEQNPILAPMPDGSLWLLHTAQRGGHQETAEVRRRVSADGGSTWGPTETLYAATPTGGVFVRQPPVVLPGGRILVPVFHCPVPPDGDWSGDADTSSVMVSDDGGRSWVERRVPESRGCVHMGIVVRSDGSLWASFRSRWADRIHESRSTDDGWTWSIPSPTSLPNNNSSIQCVALGEGRLALVLNPTSAADATSRREGLYDEIADDGSGTREPATATADAAAAAPVEDGHRRAFWGAPRGPLSLALSADDGRTWSAPLTLVEGDGFCLSNSSRDGRNRELSYPSVVPDGRGGLHVAYTHHRQGIRHLHVAAEAVEAAYGRG